MNFSFVSHTAINRLRIRGACENTPAQRLRWQSLVEGLDFHPPGLPPAAVLLVKRMQLEAPAGREEKNIRQHSEKALQEQLANLVRHAARPQQGRLPDSAEAVLFSDTAELLACLALDASQGRASQRWWWQALLRRQQVYGLEQMTPFWFEHRRALPAALQYLHEWRQALAVLQQTPPALAIALSRALMQEFGMTHLELILRELNERDELHASFQNESAPETSQPRKAPLSASHRDARFWQKLLPDLPVEKFARKSQLALLGIGLLLHRGPHHLRQSDFVTAFREWAWDRRVMSEERKARGEEREAKGEGRGARGEEREAKGEERGARGEERGAKGEGRGARGEEREASDDRESDFRQQVTSIKQPASSNQQPASSIFTELGGILFLIPLLQRLQLLAEEQQPFPIMRQLSGWAWLELIARVLLGESLARVAEDPMWRVLAELDGREAADPIGEKTIFCDEENYILPPPWLAPAARMTGAWRWHFAQSRLRVLHPAGFIVADLCAAKETMAARLQSLREQWNLECSNLIPASSSEIVLFENCQPQTRQPALDRWLQFLLPYLRWWLAHALKCEAQDALVRQILFRRGELFVTKTHIDLIMPLEASDINVRIAGLDCNPGWTPILSRVVTFHYI